MKALRFLGLTLCCLGLVIFTFCSKKTQKVDNETQSVVDNAICDQEFMQIQPTINSKAIQTKGTGAIAKGAVISPCDTLHLISGDTLWGSGTHVDPTFQLDLNNCNNVNGDGTARTGTVTIKLLGKIKTPGSKMIIKLKNYKVKGTITYSCDSMVITTVSTVTVGTNPKPVSYTFDVEIVKGVCTGATGWVIKQESKKRITTDNKGTPQTDDDVTTISGTATGTNRSGRNFTVLLNSIVKPANCVHITSGTLELTPEEFNTRTVDFGTGTCDDDATYTVNGQTIAFKLK